MRKLIIFLMAGGWCFFSGLVTNAEAYMEQTQWQRVEQTMRGEVNGGGTAKIEGTQKAEQYQNQTMSTGRAYRRIHRGRVLGYQVPVQYGQVYLSWDFRGGTCHVRYTENANRYYKYSTAASCDSGGTTIGGLRPGLVYRFQVKKDDGTWSAPVRIKAS